MTNIFFLKTVCRIQAFVCNICKIDMILKPELKFKTCFDVANTSHTKYSMATDTNYCKFYMLTV